MRYLTLSASYSDSCIKDEFGGYVPLEDIPIPNELRKKLKSWNDLYKEIIPMSINERKSLKVQIDILDMEGIKLAQEIKDNINGEVKLKYYSEGYLKFISVL